MGAKEEKQKEWVKQNKEAVKEYKKKWQKDNHEKQTEYGKKYLLLNREKRNIKCKERNRKIYYDKGYNITLEDYNIMFISQNGECKICKKHQSELNRRLSVDHCHKTGIVRGLLCIKCNMCLGGIDDNVETLNEMINYLNTSRYEK